MNRNKLYIKNMVCHRCILTVEQSLEEVGLKCFSVSLGHVDLGNSDMSASQTSAFIEKLEAVGFKLLDTKASLLIEKTKLLILEYMLQQSENKKNLSAFLKDKLNIDYHYVSHIFPIITDKTMTKYLIHIKIEKVKEFLLYDELTLTEIVHLLGYSSVAHLSNQFKKITGLTPSNFKEIKDPTLRKAIDKL